ncbi:DUF3347 domain-containing protein [Sediminibacterium soli]|uniref:DUF3347 domain-containing protein n=1 Tax=Sediminibacterium soli TaxID=2698829 RepID=UPI00137AEEA7|nr:DUF3347 domain-containing protein [Sediminibacterium soli]NCI46768.1 DUF3347 domain-containing protein [Sediminibacterium soli]
MLKYLVSAALVAQLFCTVTAVSAQNRTADPLTVYYSLKNALVQGDAKTAAVQAAELAKMLQSDEPAIAKEADALASGKDIAKQRASFALLSAAMIGWAKSHQQASPAYVQYCPMKKAYWLSEETAVRNPYYGSAMLSCGSVTETIPSKPKP